MSGNILGTIRGEAGVQCLNAVSPLIRSVGVTRDSRETLGSPCNVRQSSVMQGKEAVLNGISTAELLPISMYTERCGRDHRLYRTTYSMVRLRVSVHVLYLCLRQ